MTLTSTSEIIRKIALGVEDLERRIQTLEAEIKELEKQKMIFANEHWLKDSKGYPKYLYLIYPLKLGQKQEKKYIGSNKEKIKEAIHCLERAKRYQTLKNEKQKNVEKVKLVLELLEPIAEISEN